MRVLHVVGRLEAAVLNNAVAQSLVTFPTVDRILLAGFCTLWFFVLSWIVKRHFIIHGSLGLTTSNKTMGSSTNIKSLEVDKVKLSAYTCVKSFFVVTTGVNLGNIHFCECAKVQCHSFKFKLHG